MQCNKGGKYCVQSLSHPKELIKSLCSLIERQFMVDVAISCGNNTIHAHRCILAANSPFFKEKLEDKCVEQVLMNGMEFSVMKAFIEFMYCGEMVVAEEHMKYFFAGVKLLKISALENIFSEADYRKIAAEEVTIPTPQFITKPPKYPSVFKPFTNGVLLKPNTTVNCIPHSSKVKRRCFITDAEKACHKEAQASKLALENLRRSMNNQMHSFIVEETFDETTVENFIPTTPNAINLDNEAAPVIPTSSTSSTSSASSSSSTSSTNPPSQSQCNVTADKIKYILGSEEVEIMFQTSDGGFVNVSDEVLQDLSKDGLQYQVIDENGQMGEIQELDAIDSSTIGKLEKSKTIADETENKISIKSSSTISKISDLSFDDNDNLYPNGIKVHSGDIFEAENLAMHSAIMEDSISNVEAENELKSVESFLTNAHECASDVIISSPTKKPLKFAPEMFFADYADTK